MRIRLDPPYRAAEIAVITQSSAPKRDVTVTHLTTDSREVKEGDLFVALRGERADGNRYISAALAAGASLILCEERRTEDGCLTVRDCEAALCALGRHARKQIAPTVIAITGSAGKTTTKNMVAAVLATTFRTHKTQGNQNNLLGVCLTLLSMPSDTEMLVIEMGMNHEKELEALSRLVEPDITVITNIGQAHIGNLGSRTRIADAKCEIFCGCAPGAICLYPAEEPLIEARVPSHIVKMRIGAGGQSDCRFSKPTMGSNTTVCDLVCHTVSYPGITLPGTGLHLAEDAAYAVAIGQTLGVVPARIRRALATVQNDAMRQQILKRGGVTILLDCYNASPESMQAACATLYRLAKEKHGRSLALLGDMLELGSETRRLHEAVGAHFAAQKIDHLFTLGAAAEGYAIGAARAGMPKERIFTNPCPTAYAASAAQIKKVLQTGDVLLIKASRALHAENILPLLPIHTNGREA